MSKAPQESEVGTVVQHLLREGTLIVYSLLALFLLIALISYSPADPGFTTTGNGDEIANAVGVYGAWLADILLHLLGYLAYALPTLLIFKVYTSFRESELNAEFSWPLFALKTAGFILLVIAASGLATLHFEIDATTSYMAGGVLGALVVDLCVPLLATVGSTLLLLALFLFGLTITVAISWLRLVDKIGELALGLSSLAVLKVRKWVETRKQDMITQQRLEQRKRVLDIHLEKQRQRVPPTIKAPTPKRNRNSPRVEKERQGTLFAASSVKQLPAIGNNHWKPCRNCWS